MYSLHLSPEQREIRDTVRDFVAAKIKPIVLQAERLEAPARPLPIELVDQASQLGLRALALSEELGGAGADGLTCCIVAEELAVGDADIAATLMETARLGHALFERLMTPQQRARYLPGFLAEDRYHLALADREPDHDPALGVNYHRPTASDTRAATTAVRTGNGDWLVNGRKVGIANAPVATLFVVQIATPGQQDATTLLVPRAAPGVAVHALEQNAWHHGPCGEVIFTDCRVPASDLLGTEGAGRLIDGSEATGRGIPLLQAINLGIGRAAYEAALEYAELRIQGGRRLIEHQAIGAKLADIAIRLEVARSIVWQAAWVSDHPAARADRSLADLPLQTIAAAFTSEAMYRAAKDAAEIFGAMGVMRDMPLQKYVHDALVCLHSGTGVSDAKLQIAEALAGYRRPHGPALGPSA